MARMLFSRTASAMLQFLSLILLARTIPVNLFGAFGALAGLFVVLVGLCSLGIPVSMLRDGQDGQTARSLMGVAILTPVLPSMVLILGLSGALAVHPVAGLAALASVSSEVVGTTALNGALAQQRESLATVWTWLRRVPPLAGLAFAALLGGDPLLFFSLGHVASIALAVAIVPPLTPLLGRVKDAISRGRSFWATGGLGMLLQLDVTIVGGTCGTLMAGVYTGAFRLASPVHIVTSTITGMIIPAAASGRDSNVRRLRRWGYLYGATVMGTAPIAALFGPVLLGPAYKGYWFVFTVLLLSSGFSVFTQVDSALLVGRGVTWALVPISAATTSASLAGALVLGLSWQTIGGIAAWMALMQGAQAATIHTFARRKLSG